MFRISFLLIILCLPLAAESTDYYLKLALENNARLNAERQLNAAAE